MATRFSLQSTRFLILASLGFHLAALGGVIGLGTWGIHHMSRTEDVEFYEGLAVIEASYRLQNLAEREIIMARGRLLAGPSAKGPPDSEVFSAFDRTLALVVAQGTPADAELIGEIGRLGRAYRAYTEQVFMLVEAGRRDEAIKLHLREGVSLKNRWLPLLDQLIERRRRMVDKVHDEVNTTENMIKLAMALAAVVLAPLALALSYMTAHRVLRPLQRLEAASNALGEGRLEARVPIERDDEFGHVAQAFNAMGERVASSVERLRAANEELVRLDRTKDEFLTIVSHELRTPLNAMRGFASLMATGMAGPLGEQQRQYAANIVQSAERMSRLVNDLLDLASLRLEKLRLELEPVEYGMLVDDVVRTMAPIAAEKRIALSADVRAEVQAVLDYDRIAQVLTNLIGNAIKFTPQGGRIDVAVRISDGRILTEVRDTGIGIAEADQAKLFLPFSQVDMGPARRAGGTGLGLSISKALIEAHGGRIGLHSVPDHGSTFWFTLPVHAIAGRTASEPSQPTSMRGETAGQSGVDLRD